MAENLVIVESPAKAKTIKKYLGKSYSVVASMGHMRDLPKSQLGVDVENNFAPKYITIRGKGDLVSKLKKEAKNAKRIYLATDPDREGEAISWHLANILNIGSDAVCRITFNEITKNAVSNAIKNPRPIDQNLVDAQQARRVLDRIVGYKISPLLWKNVRKGLSAGRVQSVATRLVVERERSINAFVPKEYWSIDIALSKKNAKNSFTARFYGENGKKISIENQQQATDICNACENASPVVQSAKKNQRRYSPAAPFITSTLQQEASRKLGFTSKRTMAVAQQLYEGIDLPGLGQTALITYMRTDSLRIASDAVDATRAYIASKFGEQYLPDSARVYKSKKNAQDAHEAIRPTDVTIEPDTIKQSAAPEIYKLYKLIWERFVACQMSDAVYSMTAVSIGVDKYVFKATGSVIKFEGYERLYAVSRDGEEDEQKKLPALNENDSFLIKTITPKQHFTDPPPRYSEASLIKALEDYGIGRPSTYAPTISTIIARGYVVREKKTLYPTELGETITDLLEDYFNTIVDVEFTAALEEKLDHIEEGDTRWVEILKDFYLPFEQALKNAEDRMGKIELAEEISDVPCDKCGELMVIKSGRFGKFLACPKFPQCRNAKPIVEETGVCCTVCNGRIIVKKSQKGRTYYACEKSKDCNTVFWDMPVSEKCEKCGALKVKKKLKNGEKIVCSNKDCEMSRR